MIKALLIVILTLVGASSVHAHDELRYTKNNGQWHENVLFRAKMNFGNIYLEKDGFTYQFYDKAAVSRENHTKEDYQFKEMLDAHVVQTKFINSNPNPQMESHEPSSWYENYYIGSDKSKWQTDVRSYKAVVYRDLYDYIDLKMYQYANYAKYDFIVAVGGSPYDIAFQYSGYDDVYIKNGSMHIKTSMGEIIEKAPLAYQVIDGKEVEVPCKYVLDGDVVRFEFPQDYDDNYELIIDPILVFSTYTGSTSDNWGFTATYDNAEFAYAGGIVFGQK